MAVQISCCMALLGDLGNILRSSEYNDPRISSEDKALLERTIAEIRKLRALSDVFRDSTPVTGPGYALSGMVKIVERSADRTRSGGLLETVHGVLRKLRVEPKVYRVLAGAFEELGLEPSEDTRRAIAFFRSRISRRQGPDRYCYDVDAEGYKEGDLDLPF